ncbi:hypothetical protein [Actinomadura sp. 3N407]|uniref:hypothetical protein n=1 Tax=Actinomadura sp. 3N407 TaxID=3457423 RepID=UPI003FCD09B1
MEEAESSNNRLVKDMADEKDDGVSPGRMPKPEAPDILTAIRLLGRNLAAPLVPVALISVALTVPVLAILLMGLDGQALIINGELRFDEPRLESLVAGSVLTGVLLAGHLVMVAMVVVMVAGSLLDSRVPAGRALLRALRRSGPLLVLLILTGGTVMAAVAAMAVTPLVTHTGLFVALVLCLLAVSTCWLLLTVPFVVLEEVGPFKAMSRLWEISRARRMMMFRHALVLTILFPVALGLCGRALSSQFTGIANSIAEALVGTVASVLMVVLQGAALATVSLNQSYPFSADPFGRARKKPQTLDLAGVSARLPTRTHSRKARPVRTAALLALTLPVLTVPALLYGEYLQSNPLGLPNVAVSEVTPRAANYELLVRSDAKAAVVARSPDDPLQIQVCTHRECDHASTFTHPVPDGRGQVRAAALPDGTMAVALVTISKHNAAEDDDERIPMEVRLMRCTVQGCPKEIEKSPIIAKGIGLKGRTLSPTIAIAPSGRGIVAAVLFDIGENEYEPRPSPMHIVRCDDLPCQAPRTLTTARVPAGGGWDRRNDKDRVSITTGADGRPIVAIEDKHSGAVTLINCADAECRHSAKRQVVEPSGRTSFRYLSSDGVEVAVPPDDRPVILHRRISNGKVRLLRCRTPSCGVVDAVTVARPGFVGGSPDYTWPTRALALDHNGLPLIATHDFDGGKIILLACDAADCSRRETVVLHNDIPQDYYPPANLHMEVDRDGRPQVLVSGIQYGYRGSTRLLICRDARCGAS